LAADVGGLNTRKTLGGCEKKSNSQKYFIFHQATKYFHFLRIFFAGHKPFGQSSASTLALAGMKHLQTEHHKERHIQ
jgi:hypothetical protein